MKLLVLFVACCYFAITEAQRPISPREWQKLAGPGGFATSWFRSVEGFKGKYRKKNVADVYAKGFRNLRLRCRTGYPHYDFKRQMKELEVVVDDCLKGGVVPIICWLNHRSEAEATDTQMKSFVNWWKTVATNMKGKDYRLAFNLYEEIGLEKNPGPHCKKLNEEAYAKKTGEHFACPEVGGQSLREQISKYTKWTKAAIKVIRDIDPHRIIIVNSPKKTGQYLKEIPSDIFNGDPYMMAEWHIYASGPSKAKLSNGKGVAKYWIGDGNQHGKKEVDKNLAYAQKWTKSTGILTYFGAWMPQDNIKAQITNTEALAFIKYFVGRLKGMGIPWTLNALEIYYDSKASTWYDKAYKHKGMHITQEMDWPQLLKATQSAMGGAAPQIGGGGSGGSGGSVESGGSAVEEVSGGKKGKKGGKKGGKKDGKKGGRKKGGRRGDSYHESVYDEMEAMEAMAEMAEMAEMEAMDEMEAMEEEEEMY